MTIKPGKYIHLKGNEYEVIGMATHSETLEEMVIYRALCGAGGVWVRPAAMWDEMVEHDGKLVKRFTSVDELWPAAPQMPLQIGRRPLSSAWPDPSFSRRHDALFVRCAAPGAACPCSRP